MQYSLERRFDATTDAPAQARAFIRNALDPYETDSVETAALLASELVTNVVRHAHTALTLLLAWHESVLHVEVSDDDPHPAHQRAMRRRGGGYGLRLVEAFATAWGVRAYECGKTVWFDVDLPDAHTGAA
ncbi:MAG: regulatory protein [Actinomycetia bacterium]|nr:regulatory protein [Actinomycetes bacterium]